MANDTLKAGFDAYMRHEMAGSFDLDLYKRFVLLLSGAAII